MYLKALENSKKVFSFGLIKTNKINKQKKDTVLQFCLVHAVCTVKSGTKQHSEIHQTSSASLC